MIVVYPIQNQIDYTELKYSLRSAERHLAGLEVVVIGDSMPEWITGVTWIELGDIKNRKQISIKRKIIASLRYDNEIIFMNDDVYILDSFKPYYYTGTLRHNPEPGANQLLKQLISYQLPFKNFDGHYPLIYRDDFIEAASKFESDTIIKSMYCNYYNIDGTPFPDCKIMRSMKPSEIKEFIKDKPCFSTGALSIGSCVPVLNELFPYKSKFEI
jgi:hypothetical protein